MMPALNTARINYDLARLRPEKFDIYFHSRGVRTFSPGLFDHPRIWFEIGAGSGWFFTSLAELHPETRLVAVERSRMRGKRLVHRSRRTGLPNIFGFRGNAIRAMIDEVPSESLERLYILYPCPWTKTSQRGNRWYLHPIMRHLYRCLKPGGLLIWASDQEFYIHEARYVCVQKFGFRELAWGRLEPNPLNHLAAFPQGRTKFEHGFLGQGLSCYELIVTKS